MNDLQTIEQLLNEVQTISESYDRVAEATGENFNIFSVLKMETDEVATHSRFIAELLNPNGAHGQKDEFLKIFINNLRERKILTVDPHNLDLSDSKVVKEKQIGYIDNIKETGGDIDLLINSKYFRILIENKIGAIDQYKQLIRYHNFLNAEKNDKEKILLYLTLDGHSPYDDSIKSDNREKLKAEEDFYCVSYENLIIKWLENCKEKAVDIPILRESITQYINLIKKLTNQNLNKKMSQDIAKRVLKDQNSFEAYQALNKSNNEIIKTVINEKVVSFLDSIEQELNVECKGRNLVEFEGRKFFEDEKHKVFFVNEALKEKNLMIFFSFESKGFKNLIYGFTFYNENKIDYDKINKDYSEIKDAFSKVFKKQEGKPPYSLCYRNYVEYENWDDLNLNTIKKIQFEFDDFKKDFKNKIEEMLKMV